VVIVRKSSHLTSPPPRHSGAPSASVTLGLQDGGEGKRKGEEEGGGEGKSSRAE